MSQNGVQKTISRGKIPDYPAVSLPGESNSTEKGRAHKKFQRPRKAKGRILCALGNTKTVFDAGLVRKYDADRYAAFFFRVVNPHHVALQPDAPLPFASRRIHRDLQFGLQLRQMFQR